MKNLPDPQVVARGELTPDEWLNFQDEILSTIDVANNTISRILLYTARVDWDNACWEKSTGYKLLCTADNAWENLNSASNYLLDVITVMPEIDDNLHQIFEKNGLRTLHSYVRSTKTSLRAAITRIKKFS